MLAPLGALEVDCAACDFCRGHRDLKEALDERLRGYVIAERSVEEIARIEGGDGSVPDILRPPIERWANARPEAVQPDPARLKYRGSWLPQNRFFKTCEPCVLLCGVCIGTDKLGHIFQGGWEYYRIAVIDGRGERAADLYGEWLEGKRPREHYREFEPYFRKQPIGRLIGYGGYGRVASGVISNADLEANRAGFRLYRDLAAGRFETICDYISPRLCEEMNPNIYMPAMEEIVRRNRTNAPPVLVRKGDSP